MTANTDATHMARALQLAVNGLYTADPNPAVGCVLVKNGQCIAEGWTQRPGQAHAEVAALANTADAHGATAYVTLEPCSHHGRTPPCCEALIAAGVSRVVVAMQDPNPLVAGRGIQALRDAGIAVTVGVMAREAAQLNRGFFKRMTSGLPWISSKMAMSLDGRTAMASGESQWITSPEARADVQLYRAQSSAILTGINTVIMDNPQLTARVDCDVEQPVKVVLDANLRMPLDAQLLNDGGRVWILTASNDAAKQQALQAKGCQVLTVDGDDGRLDLHQVFQWLGRQQINTVWVEAGATLNGALLESGLVDEWLIYMAPCVLGDEGRGLFHLPGLQHLSARKTLQLAGVQAIGPDLRLTYQPLARAH